MGSILVLAPMIISSILNQQTSLAIKSINTLIDTPTNLNHVYLKTEPATDGTKCYVSKGSVTALKKLGWKIKEENFLGDKRYFYLTSKENPKIVSAALNNSYIDELRNKIVVAENTAITYEAFTINPDPFVMDNYVLGYLRSFNKNYTGEGNSYSSLLEWNIVAGVLPPDAYISLVDSIQGCKDYFSKFVSFNNYSSYYHGARSNNISNDANYFIDPVSGNQRIDLIHLFASLDGCYDRTNTYNSQMTDIYPIAPYPQYTHDLISWAGDLQQAANFIQDYPPDGFDLNSDEFSNIGNNKASGCSYEDVIADMDAVNIADKFLTGPGRVSDAIEDYYPRVYSNGYRTSRFIDGVLSDKNKNWTGDRYQQFEQEVYDDLGLRKSDNDWVDSDEYLNSNDFVHHPINTSCFKILHQKNPSKEIRKYVARSFVKYVLTLC